MVSAANPAAIGAFLFSGLPSPSDCWPSATRRPIAAIALFCLGVFVLLAHVYTPIQIGPLNGSRLVSNESSSTPSSSWPFCCCWPSASFNSFAARA